VLLLSAKMMNRSFNMIGEKYVWVLTLVRTMNLFFGTNGWGTSIMQL
jgi:hypothetical protein